MAGWLAVAPMRSISFRFSIVGEGSVYAPIQAAANIAPAPTKSSAARLVHEVVMQIGAIEPETIAFKNLCPPSWFKSQCAPEFLRDRIVKARRKNRIWEEFITKSITGLFWQLVTECETNSSTLKR
jgi:hypothetical protein